MKIERTKNAMRNILWGTIQKLVTIIIPFVTRTVLIKVLGTEYLGLSSLFTSILQVLSISELGISSAIVFSMYKPIAEENNVLLCALLKLYRKVYYIVGTVILVIGILVIPFIPRLIAGESPSNVNIYVLYFIYLSNTVVSYYLFAYKQALFSAYQREDLISKRNAVISIVSGILQIVLLLTLRNYYVYIIVVPISTIITNIANAILASNLYPDVRCRGIVPAEEIKEIKKRIVGALFFKVYGVVFTSVDTIVISAFLGLVPLAVYNNYFYIQSSIIAFLAILTDSITAGIGNKMITNSKEDNYKDFLNFVFINGWISSWCAVCLVTLYQHFIHTWLGESLLFPFETMILVVLYFYLSRVTTMTYTYRTAAGLWWEDRIRPIVATISNLIINISLVNIIGMNGVLLSTVFCTVVINIPWGTRVLFKNYFRISSKEYFSRIFLYILITVIASFSTLFVCSFLPNVGWGFLAIKCIICLVLPNILFWIIFRHFKEYVYTKNLINGILEKVKKQLSHDKS